MTVGIKKMKIAELARKKGLPDILQDADLHFLIQGSSDRRYGLVKRALQSGDLIQVRRGLYALGEIYRRKPIHTFELAQKIYGPSYVSGESALSALGLIPEATYTILNVCSGRSKEFQTSVGHFSYVRIPYQPLFTQVVLKKENDHTYFIASPLRALADYVYISKKEWSWPELRDSLRLEEMPPFNAEDLQELKNYFTNYRVQKFLNDYRERMY